MGNEIIYTWSFSNDKNRWPLWYIIALSIVIWLVVWGFLTKQYVMSFLIILITWVYFFVENNSEEITSIYIQNLWINIWNSFYEYTKFQSFNVIYTWNEARFLRLILKNNVWVKFIDLSIDNNVASILKEILPNFITEDDKTEISFSDKLIKFLKL